jgi:hypothetical protein
MNSTTQAKTEFLPFQNLDAVSVLREISDEAAAICSGGGGELFRQPVDFDFNLLLNTKDGKDGSFYLFGNEGLQLSSSTTSKPGNDQFTAVLTDSSGKEIRRQVKVGEDTNTWKDKDLKAGRYTLNLLDEQDGVEVKGSVVARYV